MANLADALPSRHAHAPRVTPDGEPPPGLEWFTTAVVFRPSRAVTAAAGPPACGAELPGFDPAPPPALFFAVDSRTRFGAWRREIICERCIWAVLQDRGRDSDTVRCWYTTAAAGVPALPAPLGELAVYPPGMPAALEAV